MELSGSENRLPPGSVVLVTDVSAVVKVPTPTDDPNDPLNWTMSRKIVNTTFVLAVTVAVFAAMTMQTVFWQQMVVDMDVTYSQLNAGVSFNVVGLAVGSIVFVPFTKKYGRRLTYILSTGVMAAAAWWSSRMNTAVEIYLTNLIFGFAGSVNEAISEMTIADLFFVNQRGTANGFYITCVMIGNFVCPTIAGVQAAGAGWRWAYYTVGIALSLLFFLFLFLYEETKYIPLCHGNSPVTEAGIENTKESPLESPSAVEKGVALSDQSGWQASDPAARQAPMNTYKQRMRLLTPTDEALWENYLTAFKMLAFPHVLFAALQCANAVAFLVLMTTVSSIVFSEPPYNFNTSGVGLMLMGPFVGNLFGSVYGGLLGDVIVVRMARRNNGIFEPEMRLYILLLPALCTGAGLILFGVSVDRGFHWIFPSIGGGLFAFGMGSMMDVACTIVIDTYQSVTAEAFVVITFIRNAASIGIPFGVVPWMNSIGLTKLFIVSGCVGSAICLLFIPVIIWGKRIRIALWPFYNSVLATNGETRA